VIAWICKILCLQSNFYDVKGLHDNDLCPSGTQACKEIFHALAHTINLYTYRDLLGLSALILLELFLDCIFSVLNPLFHQGVVSFLISTLHFELLLDILHVD
jgi:hypothetical protein